MSHWKKAKAALQKHQTGVNAFSDASATAVSDKNTPGAHMDMKSKSNAARAARAMQRALQAWDVTGPDTVIDHKPEVFSRVRNYFGRSEDQYRRSLTEGPFRFLGEDEAAGKSSAFFVFSEDGRYCIKSVDPQEARVLLQVAEDYERYVSKHPDTLLPKFYGLYQVSLYDRISPIWMLVQGNVLGGRHAVLQRFDLKGATHGRHASASEKAKGRSCVLKDMDFVNEGCALLHATPEAEQEWDQCVHAIEKDSAWLASKGLIDYSLLLGFSSCSPDALKKPLSHVRRLAIHNDSLGSLRSMVPAGDTLVVYVGIIDVLMPYGWFKRFEDNFCSALLSKDMSCQAPEKYSSRFISFVQKLGWPAGELGQIMVKRQLAARRPLGGVVGEFGRKDVLSLLSNPSMLMCTGVVFFLVGLSCRTLLRPKTTALHN